MVNNITIKKGYKNTKVGIIPEDWEVVKLGDISDIKGGKRLPKGYELTNKITPFPYIRVTNMSMGGLNNKQMLYVPKIIQDKIKNYIISKDDLYIAVAGNTLGMVGDIPKRLHNANLTENADKICNIKINKFFLLFMLMSKLIQNQIKSEVTTNAQPKLALTRIKTFKIPLPPLKEQNKIANILTTWDNAITKQNELIKAKELLKKGLMQKLLSGEIRFDGFFDEWEEKRLDNFLIPISREINKPTINYLGIGIRSHCKGTFQKPNSNPDKIMMTKLYKVKENDLIVNITFAWEGAIAMVKKEDENGLVSHRFPTYNFNNNLVLDKYFQYVFIQKKFIFMLGLISLGGAGRNKVMSKKEFLKIKINLPSLPEQQKIAEVLTNADNEITLLKEELEALTKQKKGLMQKLLSGEVRVEV